ncbi:MAG: hypothetical protein LV481_10075 [Methylacidiphilales bacterium]|nr:hypothetical protein [Candidatus Methylacidiphilales bacterium]
MDTDLFRHRHGGLDIIFIQRNHGFFLPPPHAAAGGMLDEVGVTKDRRFPEDRPSDNSAPVVMAVAFTRSFRGVGVAAADQGILHRSVPRRRPLLSHSAGHELDHGTPVALDCGAGRPAQHARDRFRVVDGSDPAFFKKRSIRFFTELDQSSLFAGLDFFGLAKSGGFTQDGLDGNVADSHRILFRLAGGEFKQRQYRRFFSPGSVPLRLKTGRDQVVGRCGAFDFEHRFGERGQIEPPALYFSLGRGHKSGLARPASASCAHRPVGAGGLAGFFFPQRAYELASWGRLQRPEAGAGFHPTSVVRGLFG